MKVIFEPNYLLTLGYAYLHKQGYKRKGESRTTKIIKKINKEIKVPKRKINFHHSKLGKLMQLIDSNFKLKKNLNKTDKFDISFTKHLLPEIKNYEKQFKKKYSSIREIEQKELIKNSKMIAQEIASVAKTWKVKSPKKLTIHNTSLVPGGHLYLNRDEDPIITIDLEIPYENMIKHIVIHEFSHYFQNKIFSKIQDELKSKREVFKQKNKNYSEWGSWFAENLIESVIITLIRKPPKNKRETILRNIKKEYELSEKIIETIETNKMKRIGVPQVRKILEELS